MTEMQQRDIYAGIGVFLIAVALAMPGIAQPQGGSPGGWGMMGGPGIARNGTPVTSVDAAASRVREALTSDGSADLVVAEVMEFSNHFYVLVKEKSTDVGAFQLIVERNGFLHPEPGPNMMWNTKYGHMAAFGGMGLMSGGMMGAWGYGWGYGGPGTPPAQPGNPVTPQIEKDRATQLAAQYLTRLFPGATPDDGIAFYGYFNFDVERDGKTAGMLSINAFTGAVWYHSWHGTFVQEKEF